MLKASRERAWFVARSVAVASVVGVVAGVSSASFIASLNWATDNRNSHAWTLWLLPIAGLIVGASYHYLGNGLERGSNLVVEQLHEHSEWIPIRLPLLVFAGSVVTHLFGGSAGREGAAVQIAAGLVDPVTKRFSVLHQHRSTLLIAAVAGGFGSVFGVPIAGAIFALEVQRNGRVRYSALIPALTASIVGDATVRALGVEHTVYPQLSSNNWTWSLGLRLLVLGVACGIVATLFSRLTHFVRTTLSKTISWYPLRPVIGGAVVAVAAVAFHWRDYLGLSIPLAIGAMNGGNTSNWIPKLLLTAITLGSGFVGGEVIPLFVIGSLLGAGLGDLIGLDLALAATAGSVAVLGAAANVPLACIIMAVELFGGSSVAVFALTCVVAYSVSSHSGIYHRQKISVNKSGQ
ncbi:MAG: voltage-gated chloride channel protein [Ilumatobacteraceae bacterium]|nr:voltage-gated chloride channel protein [Ilumatobacteraceae bacterium]